MARMRSSWSYAMQAVQYVESCCTPWEICSTLLLPTLVLTGGALLPGIRVEDMGTKTVANDLDNARVWFDQVRLPKTSLLNKFAEVEGDQYVQTTDERM